MPTAWRRPANVKAGDRVTGLRSYRRPNDTENFGPFVVQVVRQLQLRDYPPAWALYREPDHRVELVLYAEDWIRTERGSRSCAV